jgi:hypothetical protein
MWDGLPNPSVEGSRASAAIRCDPGAVAACNYQRAIHCPERLLDGLSKPFYKRSARVATCCKRCNATLRATSLATPTGTARAFSVQRGSVVSDFLILTDFGGWFVASVPAGLAPAVADDPRMTLHAEPEDPPFLTPIRRRRRLGERRLKISRSYADQSVDDAASHRLATVATW